MLKKIISVNVNKSPLDQPTPLHNRWHPDIPAVAHVKPGDAFRIECLDWTGGQIKDNDCANDIRDVELDQVHYLSGPIAVEGAEPGDLLVVDILNIGPLYESQWGFTGIFSKNNGGGFLTDYYPDAGKAIWDLEGIYATSRHIPDVRFAGIIHPGLIGTAPSHELLKEWNHRENILVSTNPDRIPPLACLPNSNAALCGQLTGDKLLEVAETGARTVPGRENGGNCDIKNLTRGSRAFFPVFIDGANLSMGDIHFSQGDGEITFCGAIEMAGWIEIKVDLIKNGVSKYDIKNPIFLSSPLEPHYTEYITFEGISVDAQGKQHYLNAHIAYQNACLNAIAYLKKFGYTGEQAYMILSTAPVEGRISGVVDIPNAICTIYIPTSIFNMDIRPNHDGPIKNDRGQIALCS
ncbi:MAG: formamidase [Candidatus Dependentiae bacterium]